MVTIMEVKLPSFDNLLSKRNLTYDWSAECTLKNHPETGKFSVYIIVNSTCSEHLDFKTKHVHFTCNYSVKYIGKGVWDDIFTRLRNKRCLQHRSDLYSDCLKEPNRYKLIFVSTTLSEKAAFMLEAEMIDAVLKEGYTFSKRNDRNISVPDKQLWNKCKGHGDNTRTVI